MGKDIKSFKPVPLETFNWFLYWICERQNIFWKKYNGQVGPWTDDEILRGFKFTNVYRCLDRVSQYLLSRVMQNMMEDMAKANIRTDACNLQWQTV